MDSERSTSEPWPAGEILRDIARGGLAGLIVGIVIAGLGGRLVMRLAALLVPAATGSFTENGNRIGDITLGGSIGLIVFVGLFAAVLFGVVWVVISPWLPGTGVARGLVAMPVAVALGTFGLMSRNNPDFFVLGHDPRVVASLIGLVALVAPALAVVDGWLDRRLPHARSSDSPPWRAYLVLAVIGVVLGGPLILQAALGFASRPLGLTVIAVGIVTLGWWRQRARGLGSPARSSRLAARSILVLGTAAGFSSLYPEVMGALGLR